MQGGPNDDKFSGLVGIGRRSEGVIIRLSAGVRDRRTDGRTDGQTDRALHLRSAQPFLMPWGCILKRSPENISPSPTPSNNHRSLTLFKSCCNYWDVAQD